MAVDVPVKAGGRHSELQMPVGSQPAGVERPASLARLFPRDPSSIGAARRAVEELGDRLSPTLLDDLRLLVSEVVANSFEHGPERDGGPIRLTVAISDDRVRAEVEDGGHGFAATASRPPADAPSGRGLFIVDQLAACWGVDDADGTSVWFELDREGLERGDDALEPPPEVPAVRHQSLALAS